MEERNRRKRGVLGTGKQRKETGRWKSAKGEGEVERRRGERRA